jgi:multidrug efflux pump subunit AcrB
MIPDGRFTVLYPRGEHRSIQVMRLERGKLAGKTILFFKTIAGKWRSFAFLTDDNEVHFFLKFAAQCTPQQLESARKAVAEIAANPDKARRIYYRFEPSARQLKLKIKREKTNG